MTEFATLPPRDEPRFVVAERREQFLLLVGSTSRIVPFSKPSGANSSSVSSRRISTSELPRPMRSNSRDMA